MLVDAIKVDVWSMVIADHSGSIAEKLEGLAKVGASLDFISSWRNATSPDASELALSPLSGEAQVAAAEQLGFRRNEHQYTLRVDAPNEPGIAYRIARALAMESLSLRGMSVATQGSAVVLYISLHTEADADRAMTVLQRSL